MNLLWTAILLITSIVDIAQTRETERETIFDSRKPQDFDRKKLAHQLLWLATQRIDNNKFIQIHLAADDASRSFGIRFYLENKPTDSTTTVLQFPGPRIQFFQIRGSDLRPGKGFQAMFAPFSIKSICPEATLHIDIPISNPDELQFTFQSFNKDNASWQINWTLEKDINKSQIVVISPETAGVADSIYFSFSYMKIDLVGDWDLNALEQSIRSA